MYGKDSLFLCLLDAEAGRLPRIFSISTDNLGIQEAVQQRSKSVNGYGGTTQVVSTRDW
jgi:hypothetical protein